MDLTEWNVALFREVVEPGRPGRRLYFYVDRDVLAAAARIDDGDAATVDLCCAFVAAMAPDRPFARQVRAADAWRLTGATSTPPFLASLAMTVLAVTDDPVGPVHGVYRRQNQLLGRAAEALAPPGYGDDVPSLWRTWNWWLQTAGASHGLVTAREHPHWSLQGWARSQGLVRFADRELMLQWFDQEGLRKQDTTPSVELLDRFRAWLTYRGAVGSRLLQIITDVAAAEVLAEVLEGELASWDGQLQDRNGQRTVRGLVVWDVWQGRFSAALRPAHDLVGTEIDDGNGPWTLSDHEDLVPVEVPEDAATLLGQGSSIRLSPSLVMRAGGDPVYLFADDSGVSGLVQQRNPVLSTAYRALVRDDVVAATLGVFAEAGAGVMQPHPGPVPGWSTVDRVQMDRVLVDSALAGLGRITPRPATRLELRGGLRVGPRMWLTTGPPDLVIPSTAEASRLEIGGHDAVELPVGTSVAALGVLRLPPGEQAIRVGEHRTSFNLVRTVHELPESSTYGFLIDHHDDVGQVGAFTTSAGGPGGVLRGTLVDDGGAPTVERVRMRGGEAFALLETGRCVQLDIRPLAWLGDLDLDSNYVDVRAATRGLAGTPAFFLHRSRPDRPLGIFEIVEPDLTGESRENGERPDVSRELSAELSGRNAALDGVDQSRLTAALQAAARGKAQPVDRPTRPVVLTRPPHQERLLGGREPLTNRFDRILAWLSELAGGVTTTGRFREAWGWLCRSAGCPADADRAALVLYHLEVLGHVEQDRAHGRLGLAPTVANALTGGGGYSLLCGARPPRLLQRLRESDNDRDPRVREAGQHWDMHRRSQQDASGQPLGPQSLYLEWDPDQDQLVREGLRALGVQVTAAAGDRLLDLLVPLPRALATAQLLTMAPSASFDRWQPTAGAASWISRFSDRAPGLYRYSPAWGGAVFAWREQPESPLRVVDKNVGIYLQHARDQRSGLLYHDPYRSSLVVPRSAPLPPLTARALVLRTGVLPWLLTRFRPDGTGVDRDVLVYRNVDSRSAERVAVLLGQTLTSLTHRLEECR